MKIILLLTGVFLICAQGVQSSEVVEFDEFENTAVSVHNIHKRDIYDGLRNALNGLVTNLNNAATDFNKAVQQFLNTSAEWREKVVKNIQNTTNVWLNEVDTAVQNVLNVTSVIIGSVANCIAGQQSNAVELVNGTINGVITCVSNVIDGVGDILVNGGTTAVAAANLAISISGDVISCGVANILSFTQVGICLNKLIQKYTNPANVLIGQIVSFTTSLLYNVVSIPTTSTSCLGSTVSIAALQIVNIVQEIPTCIGNTVG